MDTILQIAAVGVLLALTVLVVLSDAVERVPRERPEKRSRRRERPLRVLPAPDLAETSAASTQRPGPVVQAVPLSLGRESISAALRHREFGQPMLQPDPERFVQSEVLELAGPAARIGALLRLAFWILLAGLGIGAAILGMVRGVSAFFENLLGV